MYRRYSKICDLRSSHFSGLQGLAILLLLTLFLQLFFSGVSIASPSTSNTSLQASKLPGYLAYGNSHPEFHSDGDFAKTYIRLNEVTLVYLTSNRIASRPF